MPARGRWTRFGRLPKLRVPWVLRGEVSQSSPLEPLLKRDRAIVVAGLAVVVGLAWIYLLMGAGMGMAAL